MSMVVGIFPNHDCLVKLTDGLKSGGFDVSRLLVISPETPATELIQTGMQFVETGSDAAVSRGGGIMTGGGGTGVPGLTSSRYDMPAFHDDSVERMLGEMEIPEKRFDSYALALDRNKTVAGYPAGADADKVRSLFDSAGATPVEVF